ncbi:MAG TPA: hypothetical protein VHL14_00500, partial [Steroidobacteraceae bacterium]|nr:hypothetical protein [Steroidobacteraceae bacterium]
MKKKLLIISLAVLLIAAVAVTWLCYTQAGLRFALAQLNHVPKMTIKAEQVSGTLAGPLHVDYFELDDEHVHVVARNIDLDLNPALLLSGWISVRGSIDRADVTLKRYARTSNKKAVNFLPSFLHLYASELTINHASFIHYNGFNIQADPVKARLRMSRRQLVLTNLDAKGDWFTANGEFRMNSGLILKLESQLNASLKAGRDQSLQGTVSMNGDTGELNFIADVQQPSKAHTTAKLKLTDQRWLITGNASSDRWLLTPWLDNAPLSFSKGTFDYTMDDAGLHAKGSVIV